MSTRRVESTEDAGVAEPNGEDVAGKVLRKRTKSSGPVRDEETQGSTLGWSSKGEIVDSKEPTGIIRGKRKGPALGRLRPSHLQGSGVCGHRTPAACQPRPPTSTM